MAVQTILPTTNLTFTDIRDTLNNFGGSVTNVVATAFTSTAKINRWSRNKPESYKADFIPNKLCEAEYYRKKKIN